MKEWLFVLGFLVITGFYHNKTDYFAIEGKVEQYVLYDSSDLEVIITPLYYIFDNRYMETEDKIKFGKRIEGRYHADHEFDIDIINKTEDNININNMELKIVNQENEIVTKYIVYRTIICDRTDIKREKAKYIHYLRIADNLQQYIKSSKTLGTYGESNVNFFYDYIPKDVKNVKLNFKLSYEINGETKEVKKEVEMKRVVESKPRFRLLHWLMGV